MNKKAVIIAVAVFFLTCAWAITMQFTSIDLDTILFAKYAEFFDSLLSIKFLFIAVFSASTFGLIISFSDLNINREVVIASTLAMLAVLIVSIMQGGGLYTLIFGFVYVGAVYLLLRLSKGRHQREEAIHSNLWRTSKTAITIVAIAIFAISAIVIANDRETYYGEFEKQVLTVSLEQEEASIEATLKDYYITGGKNVIQRLRTRPEYTQIGQSDSLACQALKTEIEYLNQEYSKGSLEDELITMFAQQKEEDIQAQIRENKPILRLLEDYFPFFGGLLVAAVSDLLATVIAMLTVAVGVIMYYFRKRGEKGSKGKGSNGSNATTKPPANSTEKKIMDLRNNTALSQRPPQSPSQSPPNSQP